jgi:hypothetical protein
VLIEKPARGSFLPIIDGGFGLQYSPLMEYREGKGMVLFCQMDVTGRSEGDPAAEAMLLNAIRYAAAWKPAPVRKALYVGDAAGRQYLEGAGVALGSYGGGTLAADQVLIVGPGGSQQVARSAAAIAPWVKSGGNVLAIGLDQASANAFLPFKVAMKRAEHIAALFPPFGSGSLLAGVSPGDVASRDPREMSLVSGGASIVGDGVLATGQHANVVFCQLVPWEFDWRKPLVSADAPPLMNLKRTYRRLSVLMARLLGNMGVAGSTPVLERFARPVQAGETRWLDGLYLDQPEEWDDPYRFFRW